MPYCSGSYIKKEMIMQTARFLHGGGYTVFGLLLLMYMFGILEDTVRVILAFASLALIGYGLYLMGVYQLAMQYMSALQKPKAKASHEKEKSSEENASKSSKSKSKSS